MNMRSTGTTGTIIRSTTLHESPNGRVTGHLPEGTRVNITASNGAGWLRIGQLTGWVIASAVRF